MTEERSRVTGILPCSVVILTAAAGERRDAMTATAFYVCEDPPLLSVSVAEHVLTRDLIDQAGEFVVNVATTEQVAMVEQLGSTHGRKVDKLAAFGVTTEPSESVAAPRVAGCYASLECRVTASQKVAGYRVYTAEVVAHSVAEGRSPLLWHQGRFFVLGPRVERGS